MTPCRKARVIATRNRLKITGARTQPCLTPMLTMKGSDSSPFITTLADNTDTKHNPVKANNAKHTKTKLLWFSCPTQHLARKWDGICYLIVFTQNATQVPLDIVSITTNWLILVSNYIPHTNQMSITFLTMLLHWCWNNFRSQNLCCAKTATTNFFKLMKSAVWRRIRRDVEISTNNRWPT